MTNTQLSRCLACTRLMLPFIVQEMCLALLPSALFFPISASSPGDVEAKDSNLHDFSHYSAALGVRVGSHCALSACLRWRCDNDFSEIFGLV